MIDPERLNGPAEIALAHKAHMQAEGLGLTPITDTPVYNLGVFRAVPTIAQIDWSTPSGDLKVREGDTYLDFHLPKQDGITNERANEGYAQIAEFLDTRPSIGLILGVTYRVMAISAKRNQGFQTEEIPLPEPVIEFARNAWQSILPDAKPKQFNTAHAVWHTRQTFLDRFL